MLMWCGRCGEMQPMDWRCRRCRAWFPAERAEFRQRPVRSALCWLGLLAILFLITCSLAERLLR